MAKWNTAGAGVVGGIDKAGGRVHPVTGGAFNGVGIQGNPGKVGGCCPGAPRHSAAVSNTMDGAALAC